MSGFLIFLLIAAVVLASKSIKTVPQQRAWIIERFGKYDRTLEPGLRFIMPFIDRVGAKHDLREVPLDVCPAKCVSLAITRNCKSMAFCTSK